MYLWSFFFNFFKYCIYYKATADMLGTTIPLLVGTTCWSICYIKLWTLILLIEIDIYLQHRYKKYLHKYYYFLSKGLYFSVCWNDIPTTSIRMCLIAHQTFGGWYHVPLKKNNGKLPCTIYFICIQNAL